MSSKILIYIEESQGSRCAVEFATARIKNSRESDAVLLYVADTTPSQAFSAMDDAIREEKKNNAENVLGFSAQSIYEATGKMPIVKFEEGKAATKLLNMIEEDSTISCVVIGFSVDEKNNETSEIVQKLLETGNVAVFLLPDNLTLQQAASIA